MPNITLNFTAILLSVLAIFFLGFLWYSVLFAKAWLAEMRMTKADEPTGAALAKSLFINVLGAFLLSFVLANNIGAWDPVSWGQPALSGATLGRILSAAGFTWLGFVVPVLLQSVAWEKRSWKLLFINAGYQLTALLVASSILILL
jgi:hypothetical protein